ncbi:MAG TPA: HAD-IC family P-type ATPase, partial [Burkholderiaceae bacterium]|nr:HAD-IC family P-type ATPase [Burkholderiaceae bacterium]
MPPFASAPPPLPSAEPGRQGLDEAQARERLAQFGPNALEDRERQGLLQTLGRVATEPMFLLLLLAAAVYLLLGDLGEGLLLSFFALLTVGLVVLQERRSAHALDALRSLAVPQVRLLREGRWQRRCASELVPGDLLAVGEGERVAADGRLLEATGVAADESLLTGESVPVRKRAWSAGDGSDGAVPPGGEDSPWLHAGTLVVAGHGLLEVGATGRGTQLGRIGASLARIDSGDTPLQKQLRRVVQVFGAAALGTSLLLLLWHGWRQGDWLQGLLAGIAIGMALLPEEFPMALTVFLALGAWRLSRIQVLARRPAVIEALGSATLLCVDKTGTLTENRMSLRRLCSPGLDLRLQVPPGEASELPEAVHRLLEFSVLASRRGGADPMDQAVLQRGDAGLAGSEHLHPDWTLLHEYP